MPSIRPSLLVLAVLGGCSSGSGASDGSADGATDAAVAADSADASASVPGPPVRWATRLGGSRFESVTAVARDRDGVFATGLYVGPSQIGPAMLTAAHGFYLARLGDDGAVVWARSIAEGNRDWIQLASHSPRLVGSRSGGVIVAYGAPDGGTTVTRFEADGTPGWTHTYGSRNGGAVDLAPTPDGGALLVTRFTGVIDFGGRTVDFGQSSQSVCVRLGPTGDYVWSIHAPDVTVHTAGAATDGSVFVGGSAGANARLGDGPLSPGPGLFLARFSSEGVHQWSRGFELRDNRTVGEEGIRLTVTPSGSVLLGGVADDGTVDFGGGPITLDLGDLFVAGFGSDGAHRFSRRYDAERFDLRGVASDASGNLVITGDTLRIDFGGGLLQEGFAHAEGAFVGKLREDGSYVWSALYGGPGSQQGRAVAVSPEDATVILGGSFQPSIAPGGMTLTVSEGSATEDGFVTCVGP